MLLGNGLGFWKTMPMRRRNETASVPGVEISSPANRISPSIRAPVIRSFMRLKQRRSVLLPQPEGPMSAVILLRGMSIVMALRARAVPYQTERLRVVRTMDFSAPGGGVHREQEDKQDHDSPRRDGLEHSVRLFGVVVDFDRNRRVALERSLGQL